MFIGHFGVGMAGKRAAPRVSLGTLIMATEFIDLIWPVFLLLGWERVKISPGDTVVTPLEFVSFPLSHSLAMVLVWGVLFGGVYYLVRRYLKGAIIAGLLVVSHWFLDLIVQRPDLPLAPGTELRLGFGLWNSLIGTLLVEGALFAIGVFLFSRATRPRDRIGKYGSWGLVALLAVIYLGNVFGPPPPSGTAIAWAALGLWLLVLAGYWVDRHRVAR